MRIIQTFWSCHSNNLLHLNAGWLSAEYNLMSWTLSALQLRKQYDDLALYTDSTAAKMFIDKLRLPYTEVICNLDSFKTCHPQLWALPKIHTYSSQEKPFLHVDGDVFIWNPFNKHLLEAGLVAQNPEFSSNYYYNNITGLKKALSFFPAEIEISSDQNEFVAYNAGIFGGSDIPFLQRYSTKAFDFVTKNQASLHKIDINDFNGVYEQCLFYSLAKKENKIVELLIKDGIKNNEYADLGNFTNVPFSTQYLHLLGSNKKNKLVCQQLANRLRLDYPEYYYRIISLFKKSNTALSRDFYFFSNANDATVLTKRNKSLQSYYSSHTLAKNTPATASRRFEENKFSTILKTLELQDLELIEITAGKLEKQLASLKCFCRTADQILKTKFEALNYDYLYARDLASAGYCQTLFRHPINNKKNYLLADDITEIIEADYNWSDLPIIDPNVLLQELHHYNELKANILLIPECDSTGYSLELLHTIDVTILTAIKTPRTLTDVVNSVEQFFDEKEVNKYREEFEQLISERIKTCIKYKAIRIID